MAGRIRRLVESELGRRRVIVALVFVLLSTTYWSTRGQDQSKVGGDGHYHVLLAYSLAEDGDWALADEYAAFGDPYTYGLTADGTAKGPFSFGPGLVMTPLAWLAMNLAPASFSESELFQAVGWHAAYTSVFLTTLSFLLMLLIARRLVSERAAVLAALAAVIATPLFFYTIFQPSYTHALAALGCTAAIWTSLRWRESPTWRRCLFMGLAVGLAGLARTQYLAVAWFSIAFATALSVKALRQRHAQELRRTLMQLAGAGLVAVLLVSLQLLLWLPAEHDLSSPIGEHYMHLKDTAWALILFSSRNGLLPWSPVAAVAALGLWMLARRQPAIVIASSLLFVSMWWVNGSAWDWHASWGFGARRFTSLAPVLALGLAGLWAGIQQASKLAAVSRAVVVTIVGLLVVVTGGMALNQGQTDGDTSVNKPMLDVYLHGITAVIGAGQNYSERRSLVVEPVKTWLEPAYASVGNPFSFPMTWWLRWRRGLPLTVFDTHWGPSLMERFHTNPWPYEVSYDLGMVAILPVDSGLSRRGSWLFADDQRSKFMLQFFMKECVDFELQVRGVRDGSPPEVSWEGQTLDLEWTEEGGTWLGQKRALAITRGLKTLEVHASNRVFLGKVRFNTQGIECRTGEDDERLRPLASGS